MAAVLCALAVLPGGTAAGIQDGTYAFAPDARQVTGTTDTTGAARLEPGRTYRSSLPRNGKLYYRLDLAATTTAYVPVTAVPPAHATVSATDGIRVSVRDAHGSPCGYASARFGAGLSPRPVTALGKREAGGTQCQGSGAYYVLVERVDSEASAGSGTAGSGSAQGWDLEIAPVAEPRLAEAGPTTAPGTWDSASPEPLSGEPRRRSGGAGFATARPLGEGVWRTGMAPGQTLFYKVPVDWGRRVHAVAELGSSATGRGYVGGALNLSLYNPVRGFVDDTSLGYTGTEKSAALAPLPPVEYANRYTVFSGQSAVRFAGDYYLVMHLSEQLARTFGTGPFAVTLRVRVGGQAHGAPGYAGRPVPDGVFTVTEQDREAAVTGSGGGGDTAMEALAVGGIGAGTALLLVLGGWTVAARRAQTRVSAQKPTA
ncbi:hypothetical protein AQI88_18765 [Streptomyces cellostaticus]|uniref:Aromatic ring-opening dioxygenase LigA n=1 Tax=Streptomyces cellostaticus TaxID=67285 RepID=A0A101NL00_9ACTN|nr:hypothetical protein AQI88_18765 [Streptomyces cellostaticus]GHI06386.1 hypothetical protein Scel_47070 [Streptomyces cellostaticus]